MEFILFLSRICMRYKPQIDTVIYSHSQIVGLDCLSQHSLASLKTCVIIDLSPSLLPPSILLFEYWDCILCIDTVVLIRATLFLMLCITREINLFMGPKIVNLCDQITFAFRDSVTEVVSSSYHHTMSNFCRAASKLLAEISWHTNVVLGPQDLQDPDLYVRALSFSCHGN